MVLLSWRRPQNLLPILDGLAAQSVPVQVFLWNNGRPLGADVLGHPLVKLHVRPSDNLGCWPRWQLAALADTEFVCSMDDDMRPQGETLIEEAVRAVREKCPDGIVGIFGWNDVPGRPYKAAQHIHGPRRDRRVEVVKGRFMLLRRDLLTFVPLAAPPWPDAEALPFRCDDILLSLCIRRGRERPHLLPGSLHGLWHGQSERGVSLAGQAGHYKRRGRAIEYLRNWLATQREPVAV